MDRGALGPADFATEYVAQQQDWHFSEHQQDGDGKPFIFCLGPSGKTSMVLVAREDMLVSMVRAIAGE